MLFDKHDRPNIANMTEDEGHDAIEHYHDYVCINSVELSDAEFDRMIDDVNALWDEYYEMWG